MNKTVLMIMGASGSGKSTLESGLITAPRLPHAPNNFHKVVSATTRSQRWGEEPGVHYHFMTDEEFDECQASGEMIQYTEFAGHRYGSTKSEYTTEHKYAILVAVPESVAFFTPVLKETFPGIIIKNIYFDISDERLRENMLKRGDSEEMITSRLAADALNEQFRHHKLVSDCTITDATLNEKTVRIVMQWLLQESLSNDYG